MKQRLYIEKKEENNKFSPAQLRVFLDMNTKKMEITGNLEISLSSFITYVT